MAFKILSWYPNRELEQILASALEDLPYDIMVAGSDVQSGEARLQWLADAQPNVVLHFLPPADLDDAYIADAKLLADYCSKNELPVIQQSSYRVFGSAYSVAAIVEGDEAVANDEFGIKLNALEKIFEGVSLKILLRVGWLLNGELDGVFQQLIPPLVNKDSSLVASDHHFGSPVSKEFLVQSVLAMSQQVLCGAQNWGVFHLHSADSCSEAELVDQLVRLFNSDYQLDLKLPAVAGKDDSRCHFIGSPNLSGQRCTDNFGIQLPTWRKGFKGLVSTWLKGNEELRYLLDNKVSSKKTAS